MNIDTSRDYTVILFNFEQHVFQVNTLIKLGVVKEVRQVVRLNNRHSNIYVHMFLYIVLRITKTLHDLLMIITQFKATNQYMACYFIHYQTRLE
jgi:hypothetical protein